MPERTPIPVTTPVITTDPDEYEANPEKLCPAQREQLTREIAPRLPD